MPDPRSGVDPPAGGQTRGMETPDHEVVDVPEASRYELRRGGDTIGLADYSIDGDVLVIPHVETLPAHRGRGNAARLMDGIIDDVRRRHMRILPLCSFAAAHLRHHPDRDALVA